MSRRSIGEVIESLPHPQGTRGVPGLWARPRAESQAVQGMPQKTSGAGCCALCQGAPVSRRSRIAELRKRLDGLSNDSRYWDLVRTYGEFSREVERHLEACAEIQARGENHT